MTPRGYATSRLHDVRSALGAALLLAACAEHATARYPPALAAPTRAFPETWDQTQPGEAVRPGPAAHPDPAAHADSSAPLVAVLELNNRLQGDDKNALDPSYFANAIRAAVKRTRPDSRLMTQENIQVLLGALHKTLSDCQGECEVETGRLLGADVIVTGDLLRVGSHLKLDLRMHETKTGQLLSGSDASGQDVDALDADLPRAVSELMSGLR